MSLDLVQYQDGSASLVLAPSAAERRPPSFFNDSLRDLLTRTLDQQACIDQLKEYETNDLNSLISDVSLCGHFVGVKFNGVLPLATSPELSLPVHFVESSLPIPSWLESPWSPSPPPAPPVQRFISVSDQAVEDPAALRARMAARDGTGGGSLMAGADWRGFSISLPLDQPGGKGSDAKDVEAVDPSAWLAELDMITSMGSSHHLPKAKAPGLQSGLLGGWREHQVVSRTAKAQQIQPIREHKQAHQEPINIFDPENFWLMEVEDDACDVKASEPEPAIHKTPVLVSDVPDAIGHGFVEDVDLLLKGSDDDLGLVLREKALVHREKMESKTSRASAAPLAGQVLPPSFRAGGMGSGHEWAVRASIPDLNESWTQLKPQLAMQYPFELDVFQKEALLCMEKGQSVFVAAHTSAGKTVVAEYAFALATRHCTKAVYTSPIKTISNQKFRDFSGKFEVGLLTGDVQLKTSSPCLIMTTEILRSMLYKGADIIRDIEWVIFDEVHYVNDAERGVVWEEVIIMLPAHVNIIMLSATVPNVMDFADWVGRTKRKVIQVTGTTRRPVPLEHSLYYGGEMFVVSSKEAYVPEGMRQAIIAFKRKTQVGETKKDEKASRPTGRGGGPMVGPNGAQAGGGRGGGGRGGSADAARKQIQRSGYGGGGQSSNSKPGERGQLSELIGILTKRALLPVAFFTFSKKRCDSAVEGLGSLDLTTSMEKHTIHTFVAQCLSRLREEDRGLPQIMRLRDLMKRGLAVHHAGLLPIAKEMVEMLFCQGYIKVLFCTETFAMGVNAPTRTVVFHSVRKHDGKNHRYLLPSEYTQMAGRAGRRGLDAVGTVLIACWDDLPPEGEIKTMMTGRGVSLESQFRLTYSMILNLLRAEDMKVEDMLKRSFAEWRAQRSMPKGQRQLEEVDKRLVRARSIPWPPCMAGCMEFEVEDYLQATLKIKDLNSRIQAKLMSHRTVQQSLVPGRLVLYSNRANGLTTLAVVLGDTPSSNPTWATSDGQASSTTVPKVTLFGATQAVQDPSSSSSSSSTKDPPDRKLYLLALHKPGPADKRHVKQREADTPSQPSQGIKKAQVDLIDPFAGMIIKGGGGLEASSKAVAPLGSKLQPGDLPRYSSIGGHNYLIVEAGSRDIIGIGVPKMKVDPQDILNGEWEGSICRRSLTSCLLALSRAQEEGGGSGPQLLDYRSDLKVADVDLVGWLSERDRWMRQRGAMRPHTCSSLSEQLSLVRTLDALTKAKEALTHQLSDASLSQLPEFHLRVSLLQSLGYLDPESTTITLKGRALCEINSTQNELLATEMVFSGLLSDLSPSEAVALLSSLVFQEKSDVEPELPPSLLAARKDLEALALRTGEEQRSHGLNQIDPFEYARDALRCGMMQVVYEWAEGKPFSEIITCTDIMEGSIVRCIVRLDQACRELCDAARVLGNTELFQKMSLASQAIKRDIVFAASLYVA